MIWGIAQFKMIMNVKESIHRFVLESSRSKDVMSVFKTPKWFFLLTDVLQCCNIPSLAKILSRPGGGIQSHLSLNIPRNSYGLKFKPEPENLPFEQSG